MKVSLTDLLPNPFRDMKHYPVDRDKVKALKVSISETKFWDNILARKSPRETGKYEIAYGHHRLIALKELEIEKVDIPVKDISDADMVRIMANENFQDWRSTPSVINETVLAAKRFLDGELAKCETWKDISVKNMTDIFISHNVDAKKAFSNAKRDGIGRDVIVRFLGGNWKNWMVQEALATLKLDKENVVDRKAVELLPTVKAGQKFKEAIKRKHEEGRSLSRPRRPALSPALAST